MRGSDPTRVDPPRRSGSLDLIADGVADPRNEVALRVAAATFAVRCRLLPRVDAATAAAIRGEYDRVLVVERSEGARSLFAERLPPARVALIVGNERGGVGPPLRRVADTVLAIPTRASGVRSLNVAAAASVALSQVLMSAECEHVRPRPGRRPGVVLVDPIDPAQLGSSLRTAWALGWERVELLDGHQLWYTPDRTIFALGRGAARRHRNPIKVVPFDRCRVPAAVTVVTHGAAGALLRADPGLAGASLVAIPDERESAALATIAAWERAGSLVRWVSLNTPVIPAASDYRVVTAIVLAEIARRIGWRGE
jgi:tRNA(Leu) C34 or U34 (ribose-2'-O)-methylase TrmL